MKINRKVKKLTLFLKVLGKDLGYISLKPFLVEKMTHVASIFGSFRTRFVRKFFKAAIKVYCLAIR